MCACLERIGIMEGGMMKGTMERNMCGWQSLVVIMNIFYEPLAFLVFSISSHFFKHPPELDMPVETHTITPSLMGPTILLDDYYELLCGKYL